jgi:Fe-S cluster assembly protein SufD
VSDTAVIEATSFEPAQRNIPALLQDRVNRAWQLFLEQGIPTTKHEEWKYTPLRPLTETRFSAPANSPAPDWVSEALARSEFEGHQLVFVDGRFSQELSNFRKVEGLQFWKLEEAPDEVLVKLGTAAKAEFSPFSALNLAHLENGVAVQVAAGVSIDAPIQILFFSTEQEASFYSFPRVLIDMGSMSKLTVTEAFIGRSGTYLNVPVTEVFLAENAHLEHNKLQDESHESFHIAYFQADQRKDSVLTQNVFNFGARIGRNDINSFLGGTHIECWLNGITIGGGNQILDNHTQLDHAMPNCRSFEIYKTVLDGASTGVFNGKIFVYQDAQKTDAKQTNQAMLLSPKATMNTKPQLEIFADDVKCTHGATVGQLNAESLFYMRSRGIPLEEAQGLLTYAFVSEVLEKVSFEPLRNALERRLFEKLAHTKNFSADEVLTL